MKKIISFLPLLLIMTGVLACDLEIPTAVEIKGTPSLKLNVNMDFNDLFKDMLDDAFDSENNETITLDCTNGSLGSKTYIISMILYDENLDIQGGSVANGETLVERDESQTTLNFSKFGDVLDGFVFDKDGIKSKLFVGGSEIVNDLKTTIFYGDPEVSETVYGKTVPETSGITANSKEYTAPTIMDGGKDIDISDYLVNKQDMEIELEVVSTNTITDPAVISNAKLRVELVIWLPFVFEAEEDNAEFKLPGFEEFGKFFTSLADTEMFKRIELVVEMNENPFSAGTLYIKSKNYPEFEVKQEMDKENFEIEFEERHLEEINSKENIEMEFSILFAKGEELRISKDLRIMSVSMDAEIFKRFGEDE